MDERQLLRAANTAELDCSSGKCRLTTLWDGHLANTVDLPESNAVSVLARFADALATNVTVVTLDLRSCALGDDGVRVVADILEQNNCLRTLLLDQNDVTDLGAQAIASALAANATLTRLSLEANKISRAGAAALAACLSPAMQTLSLRKNPCNAIGQAAVQRAITSPGSGLAEPPFRSGRRPPQHYRSSFGRPGAGPSMSRAPNSPRVKQSPGPGSYFPKDDGFAAAAKKRVGSHGKHASRTTWKHELVTLGGPGCYEITDSAFAPPPPRRKWQSRIPRRSPPPKKETRDRDIGPGYYIDQSQDSIGSSGKGALILGRREARHSAETPGPGAYHVHDLSPHGHVGMPGALMTPRREPREPSSGLGPGQYNIVERTHVRTAYITSRIPPNDCLGAASPGPTAYYPPF